MKGTGAKRNVCPGSCVSIGAKFPVAPVESAPMHVSSRSGEAGVLRTSLYPYTYPPQFLCQFCRTLLFVKRVQVESLTPT